MLWNFFFVHFVYSWCSILSKNSIIFNTYYPLQHFCSNSRSMIYNCIKVHVLKVRILNFVTFVLFILTVIEIIDFFISQIINILRWRTSLNPFLLTNLFMFCIICSLGYSTVCFPTSVIFPIGFTTLTFLNKFHYFPKYFFLILILLTHFLL